MNLRERFRRWRGRQACAAGRHAWDRRLSDVPDSAIFYKIECTRPDCDYAMDAVHLKRIRDERPEIWRRVEGRMP
jgi:hypothetical protein